MLATIFLANSTLAVVLIFALLYKSRPRIAIQTLLRRLLSHWRNNEPQSFYPDSHRIDRVDRLHRR